MVEELAAIKRSILNRRHTRMDVEIWRTIEQAPSYEVSNFGNVRSWLNSGKTKKKRVEPRILTRFAKKTGEITVNIFFDEKQKSVQVKRLVYDTFHEGYRHPNTIIIHKDGDKSNTRLDNLILAREFIDLPDRDIVAMRVEYQKGATRRSLSKKFGVSLDNVNDILAGDKGKWAGGPIVERHYKRKLTAEEIEEIWKRAKSGKESEALIGKAFKIREQRVSRILNDRKRDHKK